MLTRRQTLAGLLAGATAVSRTALAQQRGAPALRVNHTDPGLLGPVHQEVRRLWLEQDPSAVIDIEAANREYEEQTRNLLRQGMIDQAPDIAYVGLHRVRLFASRELIRPLGPLVAAEADWAAMGWPPSVMSLAAVDGAPRGLPFAISIPIFYYNADLVARAGFDPDAFPTTWDGVFALLRKVSALGEPIRGGFFEYDNSGNWTFLALMTSQGASFMAPDERTLTLGGPEGLRALEIMAEFGRAGRMIAMARDQARQLFSGGNMGVMVSSSASLTALQRGAGGRFPVRTAPLPMLSPNGRLPSGGNAAVIMARDPARIRAAWDYIKFASGPVGQTVMVPRTGYMPINTIPVARPDMLGRFYAENPNHRTAVSQLDRVTSFFSFPGEHGLRITDVILGHLQRVVIGETPPREALVTMRREVAPLLPGAG